MPREAPDTRAIREARGRVMVEATYGTICGENQILDFCFDAFSLREAASTPHQVRGRLSLENAPEESMNWPFMLRCCGVSMSVAIRSKWTGCAKPARAWDGR